MCEIDRSIDEIVPVLVQDEVQHRQPEPDTSSTTVAIEPATGLPSHAIFPGYQGGGSGHINDYVHANGGFAFPDQALANPTVRRTTFPLERSKVTHEFAIFQCQACSDFNVLCANNEGFPCRRCDVHNMPCVVTFPPRSQQAYVAHILQGMDESRNIIRTGDDLGVAQALNAGQYRGLRFLACVLMNVGAHV